MPWLLLLLATLASCVASPMPDLPDANRFQRRLVRASFEPVWDAAIDVLEEQKLGPASSDREEGAIASSRLRRPARSVREDLLKELSRIADLEPARRLGLQALSEYQVEYRIAVRRFERRASIVEVTAEIGAVDRSQAMLLGNVIQAIPRYFPLRSRGVLEREMLRRIAERVLLGEEMLYTLGELGRD